MSVSRQMDKEVVVHIHYGNITQLLNKQTNKTKQNKKITSHLGQFLMRWTKLEPIIQSEVSQKEKHRYSILTHIYGI